MGIEVRNSSAGTGSKPKLSRLAVILVVIIIAVIAAVMISSVRKSASAKPVNAAVAACMNICRGSAVTLSLENDSRYQDYIKQIEDEKSAEKKAELTSELVGYLLSFAKDNQTIQDELTGARNRVNIALKNAKK